MCALCCVLFYNICRYCRRQSLYLSPLLSSPRLCALLLLLALAHLRPWLLLPLLSFLRAPSETASQTWPTAPSLRRREPWLKFLQSQVQPNLLVFDIPTQAPLLVYAGKSTIQASLCPSANILACEARVPTRRLITNLVPTHRQPPDQSIQLLPVPSTLLPLSPHLCLWSTRMVCFQRTPIIKTSPVDSEQVSIPFLD